MSCPCKGKRERNSQIGIHIDLQNCAIWSLIFNNAVLVSMGKRINVSVNYTIIGSNSGFSPGTNAGTLLNRTLGRTISQIVNEFWFIFIQNAFENYFEQLVQGRQILQAMRPMWRHRNVCE